MRYMSFGENLREVMHLLDMTTATLSSATGINENTLNSYLKSDGSMPPADKAVKIADALNTTVEFLVTGFEKKNSAIQDFDIHKYNEYKETINILDKMKEKKRKSAISFLHEFYDENEPNPGK